MFTVLEIILFLAYIITLFYTIFWLIAFVDYHPDQAAGPKKLPKVSVIVPAYNEESSLEKTALSALLLDYPKRLLEVIIVDDGSTDGTLSIARRIQRSHSNLKVISQENSGKWTAMNAGIAASSGEFVACLDADSTVKPDSLRKMLPYFADHEVAVVLPMLYVDQPKNLLQKVQWYEYVINMFYRKIAGFLNCIHVAPGPFSLYRKQTLLTIGCFKEGHNTEDLEICLRLQNLHYKIVQTTQATAYTESPEKIADLYRQRLRWNLGSTLNILSYKHMLFNARYGDFGIFQLPMIFFATFFAVVILIITLYLSILKPNYDRFVQLKLINFDILTLFKNLKFHYSLLDVDYFRLFIAASFFIISLSLIIMAHRSINKKVTVLGLPALAVFMFWYYIFLGFVRLVVIKDLLLKRRNKW